MRNSLHFYFTLLLCCVSLQSLAYDFKVDGFYYNKLTDTTVEITKGYDGYDIGYEASLVLYRDLGDFTVPSSVYYEGKTYSVTAIGDNTFASVHGLNSVIIPESITEIGNFAFGNCNILTSVEIPNTVTKIGRSAFEECKNLTSIVIPESVKSIGSNAFGSCNKLSSVTYNAIDCAIEPANKCVFEGNTSNFSIVIGDNVKTIPGNLFERFGRDNGEVTIGQSVTSIGDEAFPRSVTKINFNAINCTYAGNQNHRAFPYPDTRQTIVFGDNVQTIPDYLCYDMIINSVLIPESVKSIGCHAFHGKGLKSVIIPNSVTSIGDDAFNFCTNLTDVSFGNSLVTIGKSAFEKCSSLTDVSFGNSLVTIGKYAFEDCSSLSSINLPNSVTSIGDRAFQSCTSVTSVAVNSNVSFMGSQIFGGCQSLTSVSLSNDLTTIGENMFSGCSSLTSIDIPNSVCSIGKYAFGGCSSLRKVTIGKNVKSISDFAFQGCYVLDELYALPINPPVCGVQALEDIDKWECQLYVDKQSVDAYKSAVQWKKFFYVNGVENLGVEDVTMDYRSTSERYDVYSLGGTKVMTTTDHNDIDNLPAGIYIINGKKVAVN